MKVETHQAHGKRSGRVPLRRQLTRAVLAVRSLGTMGPVMILAAGLPLVGVAVLTVPLANAAGMLRDAGLAGAVAFAIGAGVLAGLSLIPMYLLAILAGWTFALVLGLPTVLTGLLAAAATGYYAGTLLAKRRVVDLISAHPRAVVLHRALVARGVRRAAFVVALLRLAPLMPFAATNLAMAAIHVPFGAFMIGSVAGMLPRAVAGVLIGGELTRIDAANLSDSWPAAVGIVASVTAVIVLGRMARRALAGLDTPSRAAS